MTIAPCKPDKCDDGKIDDLFKDLVAAQLAFGKELLSLAGAGTKAALGGLGGMKMPRSASCCDIPEACWMPKALGEVHCQVKPGGKGLAKLIVTNNDFRAHNVTAQSAGQDAGLVAFTPSQIRLGPKERTTILATLTAPQKAGTYEVVLWVTVCSDHYLRWTIEVGETENACCYEVTVDDTPRLCSPLVRSFLLPQALPGHPRQAR
jgi:hypothetical protein